jgi:hypothetical protein
MRINVRQNVRAFLSTLSQGLGQIYHLILVPHLTPILSNLLVFETLDVMGFAGHQRSFIKPFR